MPLSSIVSVTLEPLDKVPKQNGTALPAEGTPVAPLSSTELTHVPPAEELNSKALDAPSDPHSYNADHPSHSQYTVKEACPGIPAEEPCSPEFQEMNDVPYLNGLHPESEFPNAPVIPAAEDNRLPSTVPIDIAPQNDETPLPIRGEYIYMAFVLSL